MFRGKRSQPALLGLASVAGLQNPERINEAPDNGDADQGGFSGP